MNVKMAGMLCLICALTFSCLCTGAIASGETQGSSTSAETKAGTSLENDDAYERALDEMTPLAIGWTSDARDKAIAMDDGSADPRDLATAAVQRTALPYREELEKAWGKVPPDGVNTPKTEMDRFEKNLTDNITDLVLEWRSSRNAGAGAAEVREESGRPRE